MLEAGWKPGSGFWGPAKMDSFTVAYAGKLKEKEEFSDRPMTNIGDFSYHS